jgi:lipoprotein-anchoring transpeptidase ErfK/SrfK
MRSAAAHGAWALTLSGDAQPLLHPAYDRRSMKPRGVPPLTLLGCLLIALVVLDGAAAAVAKPALYWTAAPPSGTHLLLDGRTPRTVTVSAAAADRRARVTISLLGHPSVRLLSRPGNPARATLTFPAPRTFRPQTSVVTVVARSRPGATSIARTLIAELRTSVVSLDGPGSTARWAYVVRPTVARSAPSGRAPVVAAVPAATTDATPNLVRLLAETRSHWVRVALTTLPNGRTGWIERRMLSRTHVVTTLLVIDKARLSLTLYRSGKPLLRVPVGIGQSRWPTPAGTFYIRTRLSHFDDSFYGPVAFGMNARSPTLTDWPGGGIVGIHGTNAPRLIPGRISHGCIRLRNSDVARLARLLPLGTPVVIR